VQGGAFHCAAGSRPGSGSALWPLLFGALFVQRVRRRLRRRQRDGARDGEVSR
jgi:hypothetical protein